ncbi:MAG TPA: cobaltochelatase subunit CobN [Acidimicrobiales bacterium]|nr:cobaltochelatase subunit CobN [Acidimicrobiales bacterium]
MILFLSTADTELLALRAVAEGMPDGFPPIRAANPAALDAAPSLDGVDVVLVRILGGRSAWEGPFDSLRIACVAGGVPMLAFGGEATPDAEMTALSTVPSATVAEAFEYLLQGGLANMENLLRFVADTVLMEGYGFEAPATVPESGILGRRTRTPDRPTVGVVFYRAHVLSGNTTFVDDLCAAIEARGANAVPVYCYSLRPDADGRVPAIDLLAEHRVNAVVTTVLATGVFKEEGSWEAAALSTLGVPVLQAVCSTSSSAEWGDRSAGLSPLDVAWSVAVPELDGRLSGPPFSFKETVDDGAGFGAPVVAYRTVVDRVERVAGLAVRLASLRRKPPADRRIAVVLSAYPTKRSRLGNAVGLDTPASVIALLHELRAAGYRVDRIPADGDALMAELAATIPYERSQLSPAEASLAVGRMSAADYAAWFRSIPSAVQDEMEAAWGVPPGDVYRDRSEGRDDLCFAGIDLGGVLVAIQPPRGFGENPIAIYHSPDLPPTHHYLAFYRWLELGFGADAVVHAGKHGTLEWLPGKSVGLSASCYPDLALGDLPFVYPFVVNDPGEGTQAKRRAHAVIVDHLVPPLTRADTYDDLARLERLLDTHAEVAALDPAKLPAVRREVWELLVDAEIHRDLGLADEHEVDLEGDHFDELILEVDGYLCELKDAQIRGGLHVLGQAPEGEALVDLELARTRLAQGDVPSLRETVADSLGVVAGTGDRATVDAIEARCRELVEGLAADAWSYIGGDPTLRFVSSVLVPALRRTPDELGSLLAALDGRHVEPGPSGAPSRGMAHVLPTGRNFYSVDPRAIPSRFAVQVGEKLASALLERHLAEQGSYPETVGIVVWGTAAMRTGGDDVAEALALLGVRPRWAEESGRVEGLEVIGLEELGRPRIDVTLRVSGFFRDAFPHVVGLVDDAVALVGALDEPVEQNFVRAHSPDDPRIFGPKPGAYGSGILPLIESRNWRSDEDLAAVYLAWSGYSYGRKGMGVAAGDALRRRLAAVDVAVKNQDNREHDIFDSDDYLQDHGGMIAAARHLRAGSGAAGVLGWFGDSADPARPRVRSLAEEAARVVRSRVVNPKWIEAMKRHGYKGAFEMAATVDYLFGYDATAHVVEDWMYERVTAAYVADPDIRKFFEQSNPWALRSIAERLLEANERGMWAASPDALATLRSAVLEAEGWEEDR